MIAHRLFASGVVVLAAAWCLPSVLYAGLKDNSATDKPNVLFIAVGDLNDWIACLSGPERGSRLQPISAPEHPMSADRSAELACHTRRHPDRERFR